ncbi:MAG: hypothetical protein LAT61_01110 [Alcanivorax sp.]|nr:hypothetical protein [Alcanivorax sp.]
MESITRKSVWASIAFGSFTVISAVIGSRIQSFSWLLYLCGFTLTASSMILFWDQFIEVRARIYLQERRTMKYLRMSLPNYLFIIRKFSLLEDIDSILSSEKIDWTVRRPSLFISIHNAISSIQHGFNTLPPEHRLIATNIALIEIVRSFDGWLSACDGMMRSGEARYKTEDAKNELLMLNQRYQNLIAEHDDFHRQFNDGLRNGKPRITGLFCRAHGFNWKNSDPQSNQEMLGP